MLRVLIFLVALGKAAPDLPTTLLGILELGDDALGQAKASAEGRGADHRLDEVTLDPLIPEPPAIWCVGVNYAAHREETGRKPTDEPVIFMRIGASQVGHRQAMIVPKASEKLDYEGELAVIIGKGGKRGKGGGRSDRWPTDPRRVAAPNQQLTTQAPRCVQGAVSFGEWGFESPLRHQIQVIL